MKEEIQALLSAALQQLVDSGALELPQPPVIQVDDTRDKQHGDLATNLALVLAKPAGQNPRELANALLAALPDNPIIRRAEVAGPGFINFFIAAEATLDTVRKVLDSGEHYGRSTLGEGKKVLIEYVSANPTGPLHVGHGRGAAYGASVADLLAAAGYEVTREYYVNDAGRQMDILATSTWLRYLELAGEELSFPGNGYQGDYIWDIAATLHREHGDALRHAAAEVFTDVPADEADGGDKEAHIDGLIANARALLGDDGYQTVFRQALETILDDIRDDLERFGVHYQNWFREHSLVDSGAVDQAMQRLQAAGHLYQLDGATWFRSTTFGDEKDRVVVRDNGQATYFASDIAYHLDKYQRGFDRIINIWGADHHGYIARVKGAIKAMDLAPDALQVLLVQFASLYENGEKVPMTTRGGQFVTLRQLRKDVGSDAARFFYVMRRCEQHMDFDLDLARSQSNDNPVYYVQYAHARIASVFRQLAEQGRAYDQRSGLDNLARLIESHESELVNVLRRYPELIETAAQACEPHQLVYYLRDLANAFHTYYNAHPFIVDDEALMNARLALVNATRQVLANGLTLLGVQAPEKM